MSSAAVVIMWNRASTGMEEIELMLIYADGPCQIMQVDEAARQYVSAAVRIWTESWICCWRLSATNTMICYLPRPPDNPE